MRRKQFLAWILAILLVVSGCSRQQPGKETSPEPLDRHSADLTEAFTPQSRQGEVTEETAGAAAAFSFALFRHCLDGSSMVLSPLSVYQALAMMANGSAGKTGEQLESVLGSSTLDLNRFCRAFLDDSGEQFSLANGLWLNETGDLSVSDDFLQTNADWFGASVRERAFDDGCREEINGWVREKTRGRIDTILDRLSPDSLMVLVNALAFDGTWEEIYREDQIREGIFTTSDGHELPAEFMWSEESQYLQSNLAQGFVKYYEGRKYAFVALLPEEGVSTAEIADSLTPDSWKALWDNVSPETVTAAVPRFALSWGCELEEPLSAIGAADLFDPDLADLSGIAEGARLYVSSALHRSMISVDEHGTEAGAATALEVSGASMAGPAREVVLNRPFLYLIVDVASHVPLFMGITADESALSGRES